ncbi:Por secretion system C-terminal sorting domain-containing protein [Tenacibaculum sp. MAR_2009_124]|uniref:zinc-dependent metalloprotease n=1 Tax=Tenacibaculum sp. MAR_2009_124 TaxID=1250059 RepID=UPI00089CBAE1|nr:zinc-dependent metalloprotease family protein [Tenacibaculum sp. MAR_2009_124]SED13290.1 Por secretion system C-terminal sorting domain-containing protein [Tenacibaculum sp. MAR_2009_124]
MRKKYVTLLFVLASMSMVNAQNYWKKLEQKKQSPKSEKYIRKEPPKEHQLFSLDLEQFRSDLTTNFSRSLDKRIKLPNADGTFQLYSLKETPVFQEELAQKFPDIKSYTATGIDSKGSSAKITMGTDGVHILISYIDKESFYIDPYTRDNKTYIGYKKSDAIHSEDNFECLVNEKKHGAIVSRSFGQTRNANDGKLRTYRIAIASTGEYSQFHLTNQNIPTTATDAVKKAAVLSAMNTTMARVNQIYERDLSVTMVIVNNNDQIIFLNATTDNLDNGSAGTLIGQSQTVCDNIIGSANYDIGHAFSTGAGGLAGLGVVCNTARKANGVTGRPQPINDPYDIDYVAHEIGHQFGATHTFNNSCQGNRTSSTAVEPGSGSTIMAYAGICSPNVQSNSDAHFHSVSIAQMWNVILSTATCAVQTNSNNAAPTAQAGSDVSIPKSTPFLLNGIATDSDGVSSLTYNWEQIDTEIAVMPPVATNSGGPLFRSLPSKTNPYRYFPDIETVIAGNSSTTWEVLPSVAREMNFSFTVRDNNPGGSATARDDIKVTVVNTTPFTVNDQATWAQNTSRTISWTVGESNTAPINCQKVNIKLSTNGGNSFDIDLATNTDNDGNEVIMLPASIPDSDEAILMIEAADNVFYNITSKFIINSQPDFIISNISGDASICSSSTSQHIFELEYATSNGFAETVTFAITQSVTGSQTQITPSTISANGTFQVLVSNLNAVADGSHTFVLNAKSDSLEKNINLKLDVASDICDSNGSLTYNTSTTFVQFNEIENQTTTKDANGYSNFKSISTNVDQEATHQLTVNTNTDGDWTTETFAWIDWNQNCVLESNEKYDLGRVTNNSNGATSNSPVSITIPGNAVSGSTTMRISTKYLGDGSPQACEVNFDGEVEDYTVIVNEPTASVNDNVFNKFNLFPNPTDGNFRLIFELKDQTEVCLELYDIRGRLIERKDFKENANLFSKDITFNSVNTGLYLLQIQNGKFRTTKKLMVK